MCVDYSTTAFNEIHVKKTYRIISSAIFALVKIISLSCIVIRLELERSAPRREFHLNNLLTY